MSAPWHAESQNGKISHRLRHAAAFLAALTLLAAPEATEAQDVNPCANAATTIEIGECLDKAYTNADAELNSVWKQVMARVGGADYLPAKERKAWKEELLSSQRAWVQFKEHDCDAVGFEWYGGSGAAGAILSCLLAHTEARTKDLKERFLDR